MYSAEKPASRPKIRNTPIRSCEPSVVRCRLIASLARVIAVEKPMQYSVPWTSLSIVLGMATSGTPSFTSTCEYDRVSSPPIVTRRSRSSASEVLEDERRQVERVVARRVPGPCRRRRARAAGRRRASCAGWSARCAGSCHRSGRSSACSTGRGAAGSPGRAPPSGRTWVRPSQPRRMPRTSYPTSVAR